MKQGQVTTPDASIHYIQEGEGPDIVWIPGGDQTGDVFESQFAAFGDRYRCTSFDPRGVGQTEVFAEAPWPISAHAADCAAVIREVCDGPVVLAGLSLGALITQEVALSYPELLRIAIPMGTSGRKSGFLLEWEEAEIAMAAKGISLPEDFSISHYATLGYPAEVLGDDQLWAKVRPYIASAYGDRDPAMLAAQWQACATFDSLDRLPECRVPMHVIAFEQDLQTPPARGKAVADAAADGHFHLLSGLGHLSMFGHRPEAVSECIKDILDGYKD